MAQEILVVGEKEKVCHKPAAYLYLIACLAGWLVGWMVLGLRVLEMHSCMLQILLLWEFLVSFMFSCQQYECV